MKSKGLKNVSVKHAEMKRWVSNAHKERVADGLIIF